jgi:DNA-directed RNA polymerase
MSSDICRGLLEFAEAKPIGPNGINWLKIHLANVMGKDKLSFNERIAYVDMNMSIIEACAKDPLNNR